MKKEVAESIAMVLQQSVQFFRRQSFKVEIVWESGDPFAGLLIKPW